MGRTTDAAAAAGASAEAQVTGGRELKGSGYELFVLLISILSVVNTAVVILPLLPEQVQQVALMVDLMILPVFIFDFTYRLRTTRPRRDYLVGRWGWADFLAIIPTLGVFRLFRVVRVVRLLREYGVRRIADDLDRSRAAATFFLTLFLVVVVVEFAGMGVYLVESTAPDGNIKSAGDAIWWGFVTITTVGYGDRYPTTHWGRLIGILLLFAGIALFSVLTGFIANVFLAPREHPLEERVEGALMPESLQSDVRELRRLLDEQADRADVIREKLDDIERKAAAVAGPPPG